MIQANASCTNSAGSFTCLCVPGYEGNGTRCSDFDECASTRAASVLDLDGGGSETGMHCAVLSDYSVSCWGHNYRWGLGTGDDVNRGAVPGQMGWNLPPIKLGPNRSAVQVAVGNHFACALLTSGEVVCWGACESAQCGQGLGYCEYSGCYGPRCCNAPGEQPTVNFGINRTAVRIFAGYRSACAILDDGGLKCWGSSGYGSSASNTGDNWPAVNLGTNRNAIDVGVGDGFWCAALDNGGVKCWGDQNGAGQLGQGDGTDQGRGAQLGDALPEVNLGSCAHKAVSISTGRDHVCVVLDNGSVKCWGGNFRGALGQDDALYRGGCPGQMGDDLPTVKLGTGKPVRVVAGEFSACVILEGDQLKCWGSNNLGQLGYGDTTTRGDAPKSWHEMGFNLSPVNLGTGRRVATLSSVANGYCALLEDRWSIKCWGRGDNGMNGNERGAAVGNSGNQMGNNLQNSRLRLTACPVCARSSCLAKLALLLAVPFALRGV